MITGNRKVAANILAQREDIRASLPSIPGSGKSGYFKTEKARRSPAKMANQGPLKILINAVLVTQRSENTDYMGWVCESCTSLRRI